MKVSNKLLEKLTNDLNFRLKTALALECSERNVMSLVSQERKGKPKRTKGLLAERAINFYRSEGLTDEEIFAKEGEDLIRDAVTL